MEEKKAVDARNEEEAKTELDERLAEQIRRLSDDGSVEMQRHGERRENKESKVSTRRERAGGSSSRSYIRAHRNRAASQRPWSPNIGRGAYHKRQQTWHRTPITNHSKHMLGGARRAEVLTGALAPQRKICPASSSPGVERRARECDGPSRG